MTAAAPPRSSLYAGADGCPAGWIVVTATGKSQSLSVVDVHVVPDFAALLQATSACAAVAVDIPIALSDDGRRTADFEARRRIGPRRSSVFPAPPRFALDIADYAEANAISKTRYHRGLQRQTFNILPKIQGTRTPA